MAETIGSIQVVASINTKDYDNAKKHIEKGNSDLESNASKTSKGFSSAWMGAIAGVAAALTNTFLGAINNSIEGAIKRVDTLNNSARTFDNMGIGAEDASKAMKALEKSIKGLPTPLDSAVAGMTALTATYGDIGKGQKIFSALNNAILGFGGTTDMVNNAILQLSQLPMDGPLDAQTWNSLRNSGITPVLVAMAKESGTSVSAMKEAFGEGELTVQDFTDRLIKLNEQGGGGLKSLQQIAMDSTKGIQTGFVNMQTAIVRAMGNIIQEIGASKISGVFSSMATIIDDTAKKAVISLKTVKDYTKNILIPTIKDLGNDFKAGDFTSLGKKIGEGIGNMFDFVLVNTGSVLKWFSEINWGAVGKAVGSTAFAFVLGLVTGLFSTDFLTTAFNFIKDNWADVLIAVLSVALAPSKLLGPIGKIFTSVFGKLPFGKIISSSMKNIVKFIRNAFQPIRSAFTDILVKPFQRALGNMGNIAKTVWGLITAPFRVAIDYIALLIRNIPQMFVNAFNIIKTFLVNSFTVIKSIFTAAFNVIKVIFQPIIEFFKGIWSGISSAFSGAPGLLRSIFSTAWQSIVSIWNNAGLFFQSVWQRMISPFLDAGKYFGIVFRGIWNSMKETFSNVVGFFRDLWGTITSIFGNIGTSVGNAIGSAFKNVINGVIRSAVGIINGFIHSINGAIEVINKLPGIEIGKLGTLPIPQLASGGIATGPTLAMIGEGREDEAVLPLSKLDAMLNNDGGAKTEYNIQTINISSEVDGERWLRRLTNDQEIVSNGLVPQQKYMGAN